MKPLTFRTFVSLTVGAAVIIATLRVLAESPSPSPSGTASETAGKFVIKFRSATLAAKDPSAENLQSSLDRVSGAQYDIDFFGQTNGTVDSISRHLKKGKVDDCCDDSMVMTFRSLSPHITQKVSVQSKDDVKTVLDLISN